MTHAERREQDQILRRLRRDAVVLCVRFELRPRSIDAERANVKRRYGICYSDGSIRIRLRHVKTGRLLKYSSLVDTLCHELAHLRHFNHGLGFQRLYKSILAHARNLGLYSPDPPRPRRPAERPPPPRTGLTVPAPRTPDGDPRPPAPPPERPDRPVQLELF